MGRGEESGPVVGVVEGERRLHVVQAECKPTTGGHVFHGALLPLQRLTVRVLPTLRISERLYRLALGGHVL